MVGPGSQQDRVPQPVTGRRSTTPGHHEGQERFREAYTELGGGSLARLTGTEDLDKFGAECPPRHLRGRKQISLTAAPYEDNACAVLFGDLPSIGTCRSKTKHQKQRQ